MEKEMEEQERNTIVVGVTTVLLSDQINEES